MKKIYEILLKKQKKGDIGLEIECEGNGLKEIQTEVWMSTDDGSLRGHFPDSRCEYVLRNPIPLERVRDAITSLHEDLEGCNINFSFRTSVHTHVNVQQLTLQEVNNLIYLYMLFEEPLIAFCGQGRVGNRFCLRIRDAEELVSTFHKMLVAATAGEEERALRYTADEQGLRYAAINLAALNKYGSMEFRGMEGTIDVDLITTWAQVLVHLRDFAKNFKSLQEISDALLEHGAVDLFYAAVGPDNAHYFFPEEYKNDILLNHSITCDLLHI